MLNLCLVLENIIKLESWEEIGGKKFQEEVHVGRRRMVATDDAHAKRLEYSRQRYAKVKAKRRAELEAEAARMAAEGYVPRDAVLEKFCSYTPERLTAMCKTGAVRRRRETAAFYYYHLGDIEKYRADGREQLKRYMAGLRKEREEKEQRRLLRISRWQ